MTGTQSMNENHYDPHDPFMRQFKKALREAFEAGERYCEMTEGYRVEPGEGLPFEEWWQKVTHP